MPEVRHVVEMSTADRRAYVESIMNRLRRQYAERALLPSGAAMSLNLLQRLYRHVMSEGYGE